MTASICAALLLGLAPLTNAASISLLASNNETIQPAGPRSLPNGHNFFNMEGSANLPNNASFGVADFNFASLGLSGISTVSNATLKLTESNAAFSKAGPVSVYLTTNTAAAIDPPASTLKYQAPVTPDGANSVDPALSPLTLLGSGVFPTTGNVNNGTVDTYSLTFSGSGLATLLSAINGPGTLRLVVTADASTTAATYAGFSNTTFAGPTLTMDVSSVPEPASLALLAMGAVVLVGGRSATRRLS